MTEINDNDPLAIPPELDRRHPGDANKPADAVETPLPGTSPDAGLDDDGACEEQEVLPATKILEAHPYADLFPMVTGAAFEELVASVHKYGLQEPIVTYDGKILDGRNRYAACSKAGVMPNYAPYEGKDPLGYVIAKNVHRRNLTTSQRAMAAARMANLKRGGDHKSDNFKTSNDALKIKDAAKLFGVSPKSISRARAVLASGRNDLIDAIDCGAMTVATALSRLASEEVGTLAETGDAIPKSEQQCLVLESIWDKTGEEGRALFLGRIGATTQPADMPKSDPCEA
jgi:hypothetical protein